MTLTPDQITIAVTVYNRRAYLKQAVASALNQTVPVRVIVVEDCGPDPALRDFVLDEFGSRIEYVRNARRRGLFGNWNACLELCPTRWLSILHDDDYLAPEFAEAMLELYRQAPERGLYFGATTIVNERGEPLPQWFTPPLPTPWQSVTLQDVKWGTPFAFPGQLFPIELAKAAGGFRETSYYCGDWEMWCKLVARRGGARTRVTVAFNRQHEGWDRGTSQVVRSGRQYPASYVQLKRALHLLRQTGVVEELDRQTYQGMVPVPTRFLLRYGATLPPRLLAYHRRLLLMSHPLHLPYAAFQLAARLFGTPFLRGASLAWRRFDKEAAS